MTGRACRPSAAPPLIAHIVHRFDYGGLENGLVNLVNGIPCERYRHAIVCLTGYGTDFARRVRRTDVEIVSIDKSPGKDPAAYLRTWRILRRLAPAIVHTRNLGTVEMQWAAAAAGVPRRVHGEHGWSPDDPQGRDARKLLVRRACRPVIQHYVAMSRDIGQWLMAYVGVPADRIHQLYSGVDSNRFCPEGPVPADLPSSFRRDTAAEPASSGGRPLVLGTVGRLDPIKNQEGLILAFRRILDGEPGLRSQLRLMIVGDGPLHQRLEAMVKEQELGGVVWLPGARSDIPELMRAMDIFVLPSENEGISNTILEAMATGLPVVAGDVGGNPELIPDGTTGTLYETRNGGSLDAALLRYVRNPTLRSDHGAAARARVCKDFSLEAMIARYCALYDQMMAVT
jgi:sugar transferase (PEP-CTERM/EpsH1 system associated)